jgi:hypothetical protein
VPVFFVATRRLFGANAAQQDSQPPGLGSEVKRPA